MIGAKFPISVQHTHILMESHAELWHVVITIEREYMCFIKNCELG